MKKLTNRAKQAVATKNRIYECGVSLIGKYGFDQVTVEQIASKAEVSVGTYYYYFASKSELFREIFQRADEYFLTEVADRITADTVVEQIVQFFEKYADFTAANGIEMVQKLYTADNKMFVASDRPMQNILQAMIEKGQADRHISAGCSSIELTNMLFLIGRGVVFDWCLRDGKEDLREKMGNVITVVTKGLNFHEHKEDHVSYCVKNKLLE